MTMVVITPCMGVKERRRFCAYLDIAVEHRATIALWGTGFFKRLRYFMIQTMFGYAELGFHRRREIKMQDAWRCWQVLMTSDDAHALT
jgi:hypothetical protein